MISRYARTSPPLITYNPSQSQSQSQSPQVSNPSNPHLLQKQQKYERNKVSAEFQDAVKDFQDLQRIALDKQRASVTAARAAHDSEADAAGGHGAAGEG